MSPWSADWVDYILHPTDDVLKMGGLKRKRERIEVFGYTQYIFIEDINLPSKSLQVHQNVRWTIWRSTTGFTFAEEENKLPKFLGDTNEKNFTVVGKVEKFDLCV